MLENKFGQQARDTKEEELTHRMLVALSKSKFDDVHKTMVEAVENAIAINPEVLFEVERACIHRCWADGVPISTYPFTQRGLEWEAANRPKDRDPKEFPALKRSGEEVRTTSQARKIGPS